VFHRGVTSYEEKKWDFVASSVISGLLERQMEKGCAL
jgi:hypothetical protein